MKRAFTIIIQLCLFVTSYGQTKDCIPYRDVEIVDDGVIVTYRFNGAIQQQDPLYPEAKFWKIPGFGQNSIAGEPAYPFRWDSFVIPDGATANLEIVDSTYRDTLYILSPARPLCMESPEILYSRENVIPIKSITGFYPNTSVSTNFLQQYRNQRLLKIRIAPIQYDQSSHVVRFFTMIKYKVCFRSFDNGKVSGKVIKQMDNGSKIHYSDHFLENTTLNYCNPIDVTLHSGKKVKAISSMAIEDNRYYLIITTPNYLTEVNRFANWKRTKGQRVIIESRNQWINKDSVKNAITRNYHATHDSLNYVLIVGNIDDVPAYIKFKEFDDSLSYPTDLYYGCINNTTKPDIARGRLLVRNATDAKTVIDKIIGYEQSPPTDSLFYKQGLVCSYFQDDIGTLNDINSNNPDGYEDRRFILTTEEIRDYIQSKGYIFNRVYNAKNEVNPLCWNNDIFSFGDSIPTELRRSYSFPWNGNGTNIQNGINSGSFLVFYNGHGYPQGWSNPSYNLSKINTLNNQKKTPVVFSLACLTGNFNYRFGNYLLNCFAESFLTKKNGGCVGIIAASSESLSGYNDILAERMFDGIWPGNELRIQMKYDSDTISRIQYPEYEIGRLLDLGTEYMEEVGMANTFALPGFNLLNNEYNIQYQREIYHCFGDPSMMIYTDVPQSFQNPQITYKNGKVYISTTEDDVRISFYTPSSNHVDSYIGNYIEYPTTADSVYICLDKHNYIPFVQTYHKDLFIQNETISEHRSYLGKSILVGNHVTNAKPTGDVYIQGADIKMEGENVMLMPGTTITNSNVEINTGQ